MSRTEDGILSIRVGKEVSDVVFMPADWSVVNLPLTDKETIQLSENLFNMPTNNHTVLVLNRHRKKDRINSLSSLAIFLENWKFLDNVSISYGKPSSCSSNGFLPLSEQGYLFYKGEMPNLKNTQWLNSEEHTNATNEWVLVPQKNENIFFKQTYYQKFSWSLQSLMMSMCLPLANSNFLYGVSHSSITPTEIRSLHSFCKKFKLTSELVVPDQATSDSIFEIVSKL